MNPVSGTHTHTMSTNVLTTGTNSFFSLNSFFYFHSKFTMWISIMSSHNVEKKILFQDEKTKQPTIIDQNNLDTKQKKRIFIIKEFLQDSLAIEYKTEFFF